MITSSSNNIRNNKIYFLKQNTSLSQSRDNKMHLSAVHLSSIIQSKKKEEVNQEMMQLAKKLNQTSPFRPFLLTERPKSQQGFNVSKSQFPQTSIHTGSGFKQKKQFDTSNFYLSDIVDEKWNGNSVRLYKQVGSRYERSQSNKKNYKMRKYDFKIFLKQREAKPTQVKAKEIKQIVYEKQEVNKWGENTPLIHTARVKRSDQRRKNLQFSLKVQGNSFYLKKQKQQGQYQA